MNVVVQEYGSYNEYLNSMSKPGTWGDELTLAGAAAVYKRPINVVFETGSTFTIVQMHHLKQPPSSWATLEHVIL